MFTQIIAALVLIIWLVAIAACAAYFVKRFVLFLRKPAPVIDKELALKPKLARKPRKKIVRDK